jgi:hypothetical protein
MTTFSTYATATYATGNIVVVQSAENMIPGLPITFLGNTFGNVTANATYYIGNISFGYPTSNITITSLPGGAIYPVGDGSGSMVASFSQGGQQIIPTIPPGEPLNQAFDAINLNFDQIFAAGPVGSNIQIDENTIYTLNTNGNLVLNPNGIGNVVANAHVVPDQDRVRNLGASLLRWNTVYAQQFVGNISGNIVAGGSNGQIQYNNNGVLAGANGFTFLANTSSVSVVGTVTAGNVLTSGIVSSAGGVYGDIYTTMIESGDSSAILILSEVNLLSDLIVGQSLQVDQNISATGNVTGGNLLFGSGIVSGTGNIYANKIFANIQGNIDAAGNLYEVQFNTTGDQLGASANFAYNFANNVLTVSNGNIVSGNVLSGNVLAGTVSTTGNISANYYFGNGSQLTGITADNVNADDLVGNILSANVLYSNLVTVGNLVSLSVIGNTTTGNLSTAGAISATGNMHGNWFVGNVDATVISATGNVTANYFFGNGSQLTGIDATSIQNGNSNVRVAANANVTVGVSGVSDVAVFTPEGVNIAGNISATGNISANYYFGNGSQLTGVSAASVNANALVGNTLSANVLYSSLVTVGTLTDLTVAGTANVGNLVTPGVITATGNIDSAANVSGANILSGGVVSATGTGTFGNVLTGGIVSATSTIQGGNVLTPGDVSAGGSLTGGNIFTGGIVSATSTITGGNLATAGTVTATGTVTGGNIVTGGFVSATGEIAGGNISTAGNVTGANVIATTGFFGNINLTGDVTANSLSSNTFVSATGNVTGGNLLTDGIVSATGNILGNYFIGNGAFLTGIDTTLISNGNTNVQTYANGNVAVTVAGVANTVVFTVSGTEIAGNANVTGTITGGNLLTAGEISAAGNITGANVNTTTVWSNSDLNLQPVGNVALGNRYITGVRYPSADQDAASKIYVDNLVSTAISYHEAVFAATTGTLATATGGTITYNQPGGAGNGIGATLTTTGSFNLIDTANVQTAGTRILVKNEANAAHNGVYVWSNATVITRSSDTDTAGVGNAFALGLNDYFFVTNGNVNLGSAWIVDAPAGNIVFGTSNIEFAQFSQSQVYSANVSAGLSLTGTVFSAKVDNDTTAFDGGGNIIVKAGANLITPNIGDATGTSLSVTGNVTGGNITTAGYVTATGNVIGGNIVTAGDVTATGNITGNYFVGNGSQLTGVTAASVDAANLTGNTLSSNVLYSSLTTVGTLSSLSVSGNVDGGNIFTAGRVSATGDVTGGNILTAGTVSATGDVTGGNLITAGAVSATGTGTFGNVLAGGIVSATSTIQGGNILTPGEVSAGGSLTGGNIFTGGQISAVSTITGGNVATAGFVSATGNVTGGNIATAGFVSATGNVSAGNVLFGSGIVSGTGNIYAGNIFANITGNIDAAGANTEIQFNENGILGASAGFTFDTVGNVLTVNGNIHGANLFTSGRISATGNISSGANISGNFVSPGANREMLFNDNGLINSNSGLIFDKNGPTLSLTNAAGTIITGFVSSLGGSDLAITPATSNLVIWANTNPRFSNTYQLGTSTFQWKNVWAGNANVGTLGAGNLSTSGNIVSGANILAAGYASVAGNVTGGNVNTAGAVSATGNVTGGNILFGSGILSGTGNIYANNIFANISGNIDAAGNINEVQFNGTGDILTASAGFTFDPSANVLTANGNINGANLFTGGAVSAIGDITGGNIYTAGVVSATGDITGGNIVTLGQVSGGSLDITGNAVINGDLAVNGNITYVNVTSFNVEDPIIGLGRGANDSPLTFNDGKDRGEQLWYFNTGANVEQSAFIGYDNSANKIIAAIDVTIANEIVTVNDYGTFEVGNLQAALLSAAGNITAGNLLTGGLVSATGNATAGNLITGGSVTAAGNITGGNILFGPGIVSGTGNIYADTIFANISGNIDAAGNLYEIQFNTTGDLLGANPNFTYDFANNMFTVANGNIIGGNVFVNTDVSATGNITGNNVVVGNILIPSLGNVALGNVNINDLAEPFANSDAATKFYVDSVAANVLPIISNQTISPDGISNTFVLNQTATAVGILLTINGITQTPATNYTVTGNSLTMAETPLSSDIIQVRYLTGTQVGGGGSNYANANVVAYGQSGWAGNIIPSGNAVYSLGNATNQWKDLYVSGNTIYIGNVPMTIANSVLSVAGNAVLTSNTTTNISTTGNVTAANVFTGGVVSATGNVSGANFRGNTITVTGTGTAVNASSGNILTNQVTGTQFNFLSGLYTVNLNASGATANYTLNLPANAGANGQVLTTNGTGGLSWTTPASTYGNANVATFLANYGSNTISTTGNITAGNIVGNISITGNVTGTSANVQLVAGAYTSTFDNTGVLTLPTIGGDEGGEINFGAPTANTTLAGPVKLDVYQDRIRFFESSANTKGAYIDLAQAAAGVGTLLNNRVSGVVNAGTFVTMDNIKATVTTTGNRGLSLATVSGSFTYDIGGTFAGFGVGSGGTALGGQTLTTTPTSSIFGWGFTNQGDIATYIITNISSLLTYRITLQIGGGFNNNRIVIERLI